MSEQRKLFVGYDLCEDYTQISCYNLKIFEPESIAGFEEQYLIPTVLCLKDDTRDWLYGEEAIACHQEDKGTLVDYILKKVTFGESVTIQDINFTAVSLLEKFFRKTLSLLKRKYPNDSITQLVVTIKEWNMGLAEGIYSALSSLGIERDRVVVKSHEASSMFYVLNQSKELYMNDVGIFHYDDEGLLFYRISINRKTKPFAVTVLKTDYRDSFPYIEPDKREENHLEYLFLNLAKTILTRHVVSTIYVTGKGFDGEWSDKALVDLCHGRRIFKGQNLYTKGACYMARELKGEKKLSDYICLSEEMVTSTVSMSAYMDAKVNELILAKVGTPWYELKNNFDLILDGEKSITFIVKNMYSRDTTRHVIQLDEIPNRPDRMTRICVELKCINKDTLSVNIKDLGFGDFYPSSNVNITVTIPI